MEVEEDGEEGLFKKGLERSNRRARDSKNAGGQRI